MEDIPLYAEPSEKTSVGEKNKSLRHNNPLFGHLTVRTITQIPNQPRVYVPQIVFIFVGFISKDLSPKEDKL